MSSSDRQDEAADEAAAARRCNNEGKKDNRRDDRHSCFLGPVASPPRFVTAVLRRGEKLCPAKKTPQKSVELKVSSSAKQILWPMDLDIARALMTANQRLAKVSPRNGSFFSDGSRRLLRPLVGVGKELVST